MTTISETSPFEQLGLTRKTQAADTGSLGQEDFLELMITQLRNQDPFKPMESGEFLGQLASFGTVEGIGKLQNSFAQLSTSLTSNQALQASSLLDREVLFASDRAYLGEGESVRGAVELPYSTTQVAVGVYSRTGELLRRIDLGPQQAGRAEFEWDGLNEDGLRLMPGEYEIRAEAISGDRAQSAQVLVQAPVANVTLGGLGEPLSIGIDGLGDIPFAAVRKIG
jgi:flagellar basal-body rod modification protein FlgD